MAKRTALYRHFDAAGALLYVGVSLCAAGRLAQHRTSACWFDRISRIDVEWHPNREEAVAAERVAINTEAPMFNTSRPPMTHNDLMFRPAYRAGLDELDRGLQ